MDQQPKSDNTNRDPVYFKVTLLRKSSTDWDFNKIEVRMFQIPEDLTSLLYVKERIREIFGNKLGQDEKLKIYWKDKDGDFIRVTNDEELLIGLLTNKEVFNLTVVAGPGNLIVTEDNEEYLAHVH
jgi:hypothetical protein